MTTALLAMDFTPVILGMLGENPPVAAAATEAVEAATQAGVDVVFVRVGFRPGYAELSPRNKNFAPVGTMPGVFDDNTAANQVHPALTAVAAAPVVLKRRVSAFTGSDLDVLLRARGIDHLVLAGVATSGVVLSTLREASDRDFGLTVLADACADPETEVHDFLVTRIFPPQADVVTVKEWASAL